MYADPGAGSASCVFRERPVTYVGHGGLLSEDG